MATHRRTRRKVYTRTAAGMVSSRPTTCLGCRCVVTMSHRIDADPVTGAWECPQCKKLYPFRLWRIKPRKVEKEQVVGGTA